jgi:hypothetical protein
MRTKDLKSINAIVHRLLEREATGAHLVSDALEQQVVRQLWQTIGGATASMSLPRRTETA